MRLQGPTVDDLERYYEILGLKPGASPEEVKQAYRDLAKVWHPDRFSHDSRLQRKAQEKLKEINEAYERLSSFRPGSRRATSRAGRQPHESQPSSGSSERRSREAEAAPSPHASTEPAGKPPRSSRVPIWLGVIAAIVAVRLISSQLSGPSKPITPLPQGPPPVSMPPTPPSKPPDIPAESSPFLVEIPKRLLTWTYAARCSALPSCPGISV